MAQKYCVTIPMQVFDVLFWRRFFQVTWEVHLPLLCRLAQSALTTFCEVTAGMMAIQIFLLFVSLLDQGSCLVKWYELLAEDEGIVPLGSLRVFSPDL